MTMKAGRVSAATICDWLDVSKQTFANMIDAGIFERNPSNVGYDLRTVVRVVVRHYQKLAAGRGGADGGAALTAARARQAIASAETMELKNAVSRHEFVPIELVTEQLIALFMTIREKWLALPGKIADELATHCSDIDRAAVEVILEREIFEMLEELAAPEFSATKPARATLRQDIDTRA